MTSREVRPLAPPSDRVWDWQRAITWLFGICAAIFGLARAAGWTPPWGSGVTDAALVVLGFLAAVGALASRLPLQNVLSVAVIYLLFASAIVTLTAHAREWFGPAQFNQEGGPKLLRSLPVFVPLLWTAALLTARSVARLIVRPLHRYPQYGLIMLLLTAFLLVLFDLGLQPYAAFSQEYWRWPAEVKKPQWYGAPWVHPAFWFVGTLVVVPFATPWLVNKRPPHPRADLQPLVVWAGLNGYLFFSVVGERLWPAVGVSGIGLVGAIVLGFRGSRRLSPEMVRGAAPKGSAIDEPRDDRVA